MLKLASALVVSTLALAACSDPAPPPVVAAPAPVEAMKPEPTKMPAPAPTPAAAVDPKAEADTIFSQRCAVCHGMTGVGDGPGAAAINPKPRNYADAAWQKSVTDDYIAKVIVEGGAAVGKSPMMIANADLKDKPEVVKALVAKVRSFGAAK